MTAQAPDNAEGATLAKCTNNSGVKNVKNESLEGATFTKCTNNLGVKNVKI